MDSKSKQELLDAIANDPNKAFPTFNWQPNTRNVARYGAWTSSVHIGGRESSDHNRHQTYIKDGKTDRHAIIADENGDSIEVLTLWQQEHGENSFDDLFAIYGMTPPQRDAEKEKKAKQDRTDTEKLLADIRADYLGPRGEQVRAYLSRPKEDGGRGWDDATIQAMADYIGVITPDTARRLSKLLDQPIPQTIGNNKPLLILTFDKRGAIQYAKFRSLTPKAEWHNPANANGEQGRDNVDLYNYNHTSFLTDNNARHVVIVESELDAAHATIAGIKNVVALRGSDGVKPPALRRLNGDKCERIVLLFDNDDKGRKATAAAIKAIPRTLPNMDVRVATIPADWGVKDVDDVLSCFPDGAQRLRSIIDDTQTPNQWNAARYAAAQTEEERDQIEIDVLEQVASIAKQNPIRAEKLSFEFCHLSGAVFTPETMTKQAQAQAQAAEMEQYEKRRKRLFDELDKARQANDVAAIGDAVSDLYEMKPPTDDPELRDGGTMDATFAELYRDASLDLKTNYNLYTRRPDGETSRVPLKLYANGITYFAGGTSHGKSTILQNVAFDLLEQGKRVLYYGFEETKRDTLLEFVNIYVHKHTQNAFGDLSSDGSTDAINKFFESQNPATFDVLDDYNRKRVADAIRGFFNDFRGVDGGKRTLFVYDDALTSAELVDHINTVAPQIRPDAVFIDYVQFLVSDPDNPKASQWEDLGRVSKDLIKINKTTGVPVIVAAQVKEKNNTKDNPFALRYTDIFGASSIAQGAAAVYLLGNATKYERATTVEYMGEEIPFGQSGMMAVKLDKNRFGPCPAYALYDYDGAKRYIDAESLREVGQNKPANKKVIR